MDARPRPGHSASAICRDSVSLCRTRSSWGTGFRRRDRHPPDAPAGLHSPSLVLRVSAGTLMGAVESEMQAAVRLAIAALIGLAVGLEREWSGHSIGPDARFAGLRTFLLLGTIGGAAGLLLSLGF